MTRAQSTKVTLYDTYDRLCSDVRPDRDDASDDAPMSPTPMLFSLPSDIHTHAAHLLQLTAQSGTSVIMNATRDYPRK